MPHPIVSRAAYVPWSIRRIDRVRFRAYLTEASRTQQTSTAYVLADVWRCLQKYHTTPMDYFYFRFFELSDEDRRRYVSSLQLHDFHRAMNSGRALAIAADKVASLRHYGPLVSRRWFDLPTDSTQLLDWLRGRRPKRIVVKNPRGTAGRAVKVVEVTYAGQDVFIRGVGFETFVHGAVRAHATLVEEYLDQHPGMALASSKSVNTVRVITRFDGVSTRVVSAILRLGWGGEVDNFDAGGASVWLDAATGAPAGKPVLKDPFRRSEPQSDSRLSEALAGFVTPHWDGVLEAVQSAGAMVPELRTAGWDFAITVDGPEFIEVNHNWDKTHWQVSEGRGRARDFETWWRP